MKFYQPLEYDVPVSSTSDGSAPIDGTTYDSKASPLVDPYLDYYPDHHRVYQFGWDGTKFHHLDGGLGAQRAT